MLFAACKRHGSLSSEELETLVVQHILLHFQGLQELADTLPGEQHFKCPVGV
jgi:hypothetical protein